MAGLGAIKKGSTVTKGDKKFYLVKKTGGKNRGRTCVVGRGFKAAFKGGSDYRFFGCFNSADKAKNKLTAVARSGGRKSRKRRKSRRRRRR